MLGLETALALAITELGLPLQRVLALLSWGPAAIAGVADRTGWAEYVAEYDRTHRPTWEAFNAWQKNVAETHGEGVLSPYLVFSLFSDAKLKLTLSPEIEAWRRQVLTPPEAAPA